MPMPGPVVLTADQRALLQARLDEANAQYHALMTGTSVATVRDQNGETITYSIANVDKLAGYITSLQMQLGINAPRTRRPLQIYMGGR